MDDLRVESYDEKKVVTKKRLILKRIALAGGAIVVLLGLFGIWHNRIESERGPLHHYATPGGSGSWLVSVLVRE